MPNTSQTSFLSNLLGPDPIAPHKVAYFRARLSNRLHDLVLRQFASLEAEGKINRSLLARRIGRKPEQITRWFGSPGNWTLETLSDLLLGMGLELVPKATSLFAPAQSAQKPANAFEQLEREVNQEARHLVEGTGEGWWARLSDADSLNSSARFVKQGPTVVAAFGFSKSVGTESRQ